MHFLKCSTLKDVAYRFVFMTYTEIKLEDYHYHLPEERIAKFPLPQRDQARLLVYRQGQIQDHVFFELPSLLPANSSLFFNNTKVIPARLYFRKESQQNTPGALIEIFLLHPVQPSPIITQAMLAQESCTWQCIIGNQKKWKRDMLLKKAIFVDNNEVVLTAQLADEEQKLVTFRWDRPAVSFVDIVEAAGQVPLPPYLKREVTEEDKPRYQTVYSVREGAVAAPTAGLHFTEEILKAVHQKGIALNYLTLHVSAGTFQPIKEEIIQNHPMHSEQVIITQENLHSLLAPGKRIIAVGTTSMRTLESLYWYGVQLLKKQNEMFQIKKTAPYQYEGHQLPSSQESIQAILHYMQQHHLDKIVGETEIFIFPGYQFKICGGLITNFHMPKSTLILLIAAFVGEGWRSIYEHALKSNYRFLSYGDSSLLLK